MKRLFSLLALTAMLPMMSHLAQGQSKVDYEEDILRYEGQWPDGEGVLYSSRDGLILGSFRSGKPEGKCVCYKPNGEVYWGDYKKGKATGQGRLYRDNGVVFAGGFKNGVYHGTDTLYRPDGSVFVGKFRKGKLRGKTYESASVPSSMKGKPSYPRIDLRQKQEDFLRELELRWEYRNLRIRQEAGFVNPKFQGGNIEDFELWVGSKVICPESFEAASDSRIVIVEFTVLPDGSLSGINAVFGSNPDLNKAAVEAVAKSPRWEPGLFNGVPRETRMRVPVLFNAE